MRWAFLWILAFGCSVACELPDDDDDSTQGPVAEQPCASWGNARTEATVQTQALNEISGLVVSRRDPDLLWVHEDSGSEAMLWALGRDGRVRGRVALENVTAIDWEDIALGPCGDVDCLWIGDIGDNAASRDHAIIYRVQEPDVLGGDQSVTAEPWPFRYPGGPQDAEALIFFAGSPVVLTKQPGQRSTAFAVPGRPHELVDAVLIGELDLQTSPVEVSLGLTGADSWGDHSLLLRGYFDLGQWPLTDGLASFATEDGRAVPFVPEPQGEAVAWDPHARGVWTISEAKGGSPDLHFTPCRG